MTTLTLVVATGCEAKYGTVDTRPENPSTDDASTDSDGSTYFSMGPVKTCSEPTVGFERFTASGRTRGLTGPIDSDTSTQSCMTIPGGLAAHDLNNDGLPELSFHDRRGFPWIYCNSGDGTLRPCMPGPEWTDERDLQAHGWVDIDGNRRPDLVAVGLGFVATSLNFGDGEFSDFEVIWEQTEWPRTCMATFAWGDLTGDGVLDLILPGADLIPAEGSIPLVDHPMDGAPVHVLEGDGLGNFSDIGVLTPTTNPTLSVLAAVTDRDLDGDQDILLVSDRSPMGGYKTAFFRNENGQFTDDAPSISADLGINGMGLGQADINEDGLPDYCMSSIAPTLVCLLSDGDGGYYEGGSALGLFHRFSDNPTVPEETTESELAVLESQWSPWSVEMTDLNNDAKPDAATVAGVPPEMGSILHADISWFQPDAIWQGTTFGFVERTKETGFGNLGMNSRYGLATADLDGDGWLEIITAGYNVEPDVWNNPCGSESWLQIDFMGPTGNTQGFGTTVSVTAEERMQQQQLHGLRTVGQGPDVLHFGLGRALEARVDVLWPGGIQTSITVDGLNRRITATHPAVSE